FHSLTNERISNGGTSGTGPLQRTWPRTVPAVVASKSLPIGISADSPGGDGSGGFDMQPNRNKVPHSNQPTLSIQRDRMGRPVLEPLFSFKGRGILRQAPDLLHPNRMVAMSITAAKGYLVRRLSEAPTVPCPCGQSTRPLTRADTPLCNLHVTHITDSVKHYHRECTEVYYILEGRGKMELNGDVIEVEPGTVVVIEPYTPHRLWSPEGVRTIVFGVPALRPEDEYFDVR